jgi:hypothetical protein
MSRVRNPVPGPFRERPAVSGPANRWDVALQHYGARTDPRVTLSVALTRINGGAA